ncbi:hypothetical protein HSB1_41200 [Halogranum salarium B-1]|uniref:Uncharacterized protein n=1 Tax=Halogranum salarium B-1 TaxID=1210908 RepID=J3ETG4_9EURY|nr:hypothetical protein HSB1_41200 [Halogranum salarium B-1]
MQAADGVSGAPSPGTWPGASAANPVRESRELFTMRQALFSTKTIS